MEFKKFIESTLVYNGVKLESIKPNIQDALSLDPLLIEEFSSIANFQTKLMMNYNIKNRIFDVENLKITIPNATNNKAYDANLDIQTLIPDTILLDKFEGLEEIGLTFNSESKKLEGILTKSGDLQIKYLYKVKEQDESSEYNTKHITLVVNPDPKDLWQNIPSNQEDIFAKPDDISVFDSLGEKSILVSSKRGRSHANVGTSRDDDFAFKQLDSGWSVVVVSDGAGSAGLARKGSLLACESVVNYFDTLIDDEKLTEFEKAISSYSELLKDESTNEIADDKLKEMVGLSKQLMYKASLHAYTQIKDLADKTISENPELFNNPKAKSAIDYFHSTLIFVVFKKFDFGYLIQSFGVGDCPIAFMNLEKSETTMMNWLDVGEFGGGTRFITQPEIFSSTERPAATRFNMKIIPDFSFLFLMTDGIYDAKFIVEANLEKHDKWLEFLADLDGRNDDNSKVVLNKENKEITNEISKWMDFWSVGNHDDRTLAIIF